MHEPGNGLVVPGVVLLVIGGALMAAVRLPSLGKLPGELRFRRGNFTFSFPLAMDVMIGLPLLFGGACL